MTPNRVHLVAPANPLGPDAKRFGFAGADEFLRFARQHVPAPLRLTYAPAVMRAVEDEFHGGRRDDEARRRDLQQALADPRTRAIVATNGGAYLSRILPALDFSVLRGRKEPLWMLGFSEISGLVNLVASYPCGRGVYWLCPTFLGAQDGTPEEKQARLAEFWRALPALFAGRRPADADYLAWGPIEGRLVAGRVTAQTGRLVGGCLAVLAGLVGGEIGRRIHPRKRWLFLEDVKETPYRIDRHLAALKLAGWFEQCAGLIVGDFRMMHTDTQPAVLALLKYHLSRERAVPVITTRSFGHCWPMVPVLVNRPVRFTVRGRTVRIAGAVNAGGTDAVD